MRFYSKLYAALLCVAAASVFVSCEKDDASLGSLPTKDIQLMAVPTEVRVFKYGESDNYCREFDVYKLTKAAGSSDSLMGYEVRTFESKYLFQETSWDFEYLASHKFTFESLDGNPFNSDDYQYLNSRCGSYSIYANYVPNIQYNAQGKVARVGTSEVDDVYDVSVEYSYDDAGHLSSSVSVFYGSSSYHYMRYKTIISYEWTDDCLTAIDKETYWLSNEGQTYGYPSKSRFEMTYAPADLFVNSKTVNDKSGQKVEVLNPNILCLLAYNLQDEGIIGKVSYEDLFLERYGSGFMSDKVLTSLTYYRYEVRNTDPENSEQYELYTDPSSTLHYFVTPSFNSDGVLESYDIKTKYYVDNNMNNHTLFKILY